MDPTIYSKLPFGGSLWDYKSSAKDVFIQKPYHNPNIVKAIFGTNITEKSSQPREKKETLMKYIIKQIDPLSSLYTYTMFEQAENIFRDKLTDFVSKGVGQQWLGPKKSRVLLAWLTRNNHGVIDDMGKIIADFLTWLLESTFKYIPEHAKTIVDSREDNVTYITYDKRTFVIK